MSSTPIAAYPSLGSTLLDADLQRTQTERPQLTTGLSTIDEALAGGINCTEIVSIASKSRQARSTLALHFIASYLLSDQLAEVVIVDATGAFAAEDLRTIIADRLIQTQGSTVVSHAGYVYQPALQGPAVSRDDILDRATAVLDRVKLARIFDLTGLVEIVGEARKSCESKLTRAEEKVDNEVAQQPGPLGLLVVDDLASILSPMISSNHTEAQALLASLHRSLTRLARSHCVCTMLLNGVAGVSQNETVRDSTDEPGKADGASGFRSVAGRPALGRTFASLIDLSILLSKVPKSRKDAELVHGGGPSDGAPATAWSDVLEVLKDRTGFRQDRIAAFELTDALQLKECSG